jgi:hypothetical protein
MSQAQKEGVWVTHGAQTRHCDHGGNIHGQSERPQMVYGQCSKCPMVVSSTMQKEGGDLVCVLPLHESQWKGTSVCCQRV